MRRLPSIQRVQYTGCLSAKEPQCKIAASFSHVHILLHCYFVVVALEQLKFSPELDHWGVRVFCSAVVKVRTSDRAGEHPNIGFAPGQLQANFRMFELYYSLWNDAHLIRLVSLVRL